jgi:hypothetical protein
MRRTWLRLIWIPCWCCAASVSAFKGKSGRPLLVGLVPGSQAAIRLQDEPTGRQQGHEGHERAAFACADAPLAPGTGPIAQPVDPMDMEGLQSLTHRLLMARKFSGDGSGAQPLPAEQDHLRPADPISGGVPTGGELAYLAFLGRILGWASHEEFGHETPPFPGDSRPQKLYP